MSEPPVLPSVAVPAARYRYAEWIWRVISWIVDALVPALLFGVGYLVAPPGTEMVEREVNGFVFRVEQPTGPGALFYVLVVAGLAFGFWNKAYREGRTGKSIGKQLTNYTTVRESTGAPLGFGRGALRWLLLWADFGLCYLGVLWPLWDDKRQCLLSDKLTGAVVYRD